MTRQKIIAGLKTTGFVSFWLVMVACLMVSLSFVNKEENNITCSKVVVNIEPETELRFVDREMVLKTIRADGNEKRIINQKITDLHTPELEGRLLSNPFIRGAEVFTDMNGSLHIHIRQREPVLRVINSKNESFYIDRNGSKMPVSLAFTARVPVATGNIFEDYNGSDSIESYVGKELLKIATYVDKDAFWKAQIEQIFVNTESELVLVPKVGEQMILFGSTEEMEDKFNRLMLFYKEALSRIGWDKYSSIDLRYKEQIVCRKKIK